jgi:hypothetical protein
VGARPDLTRFCVGEGFVFRERDVTNGWLKLTQPVMIQSFSDEFELPNEQPNLPASPGSILLKIDGEQLSQHFDLDEQGELREYVGCKIELRRVSGSAAYSESDFPVMVNRKDRSPGSHAASDYVKHTKEFGNCQSGRSDNRDVS